MKERLSIVHVLCFDDGRKDKKLQAASLEGKKYLKTAVEEHVTLIQEPGSKYLGHGLHSRGTEINITKSITDYLIEKKISADNIVAIGCDGTKENTGRKGGELRFPEVCFRNHHNGWYVNSIKTIWWST